MIEVGQVKYEKKVLIIYNPNSGRKIDQRTFISDKLSEHGIKYEIINTEK